MKPITPPILRRAVVAVLLLSCCLPASAQTSKIRLAVVTLENPSTSSTIGNGLTEMVIGALQATGKFQLVDAPSPADTRRHFVLKGKVTNFSFDETQVLSDVATACGMARETRYRQTATVRVDFQILKGSGGDILIAESASATENTVSAAAELATYQRVLQTGVLSLESQNSLIGRATARALDAIVRKILDLSPVLSEHTEIERSRELAGVVGHVIAIVAGSIVIDLGTAAGLQKGSRLTVLRQEVIRNSDGQIVFTEERQIGVLEVTGVDASGERAKALLTSESKNAAVVREGDIVRVSAVTSEKAAVPSPERAGLDENGDVQTLLRQGDRYVEDEHYSAALDSYRKALAIKPASTQVMKKVVDALLRTRQIPDAETLIARLLDAGGALEIDVIHAHGWGTWCEGALHISDTQLFYRPLDGDHGFGVGHDRIGAVEPGLVGKWPVSSLRLEWRDDRNKKQDDDFLAIMYGRPLRPSDFMRHPELMNRNRQFDRSVVPDIERLHRVMIRLVRERVPALEAK